MTASLPPALAGLADPDAEIRRVTILREADLALVAPAPFIAATRDPVPDVQAEALLALEGTTDLDAVTAILDHIDHAHPTVRQAAAHALESILTPSAAPLILDRLERTADTAKAPLLATVKIFRDSRAFSPAIGALDAEPAAVRIEAVAVLGYLRDERCLPHLARLAGRDSVAKVRRAAISAIGCFSGDAVAQPLTQALEDPDWQVREEAATGIGRALARPATEALIGRLDDPYWQVAAKAALSLGQLGAARAVSPLAALLAHPVSNLRKDVAVCLGMIGGDAARRALTAAQNDPDLSVRKAAVHALSQL